LLISAPLLVLPLLATLSCTRPEDGDGLPRTRDLVEPDSRLTTLPYLSWSPQRADPELRGVVRNDPDRVAPGFNLYCDESQHAYLVDNTGRRAHQWIFPFEAHWEYAALLDDGDLVAVAVGSGVVRLDRDSEVRWFGRLPSHHDVEPTPTGTFLVPFTQMRRYRGMLLGFDAIAELSGDGQMVRTWATYSNLDALRRHHPLSFLDRVDPTQLRQLLADADRWDALDEYYHLNSVKVLPETPLGRRDPRFAAGNWLVCLRQVDTILVLDPRSGSVTWSWGDGILDWPHLPMMLPDGRIIVYDNGRHRGWSRVLIIDAPSGHIRWEYRGAPPDSFFSPYRGSAQALPEGTILILDAEAGRAFEITSDGDVVWEFYNPEIKDGHRKRIYRLLRYPPEKVTPWLDAGVGG
jgi:hypothetical protein